MDHSPLFIRWEYGENPNQLDDNYINVRNAQRDEFKQVIYSSLSNKYIELFGFQLKEGRLWNDSVDQWTDYKMIINESAKSLLEIDNIETALVVLVKIRRNEEESSISGYRSDQGLQNRPFIENHSSALYRLRRSAGQLQRPVDGTNRSRKKARSHCLPEKAAR